jgi:DNA-directed RNA polymerase specialized sigma24 family protein
MHVRKGNGTATNQKRKPMKAKSSRFDSLVARYYPVVYSFASRLTDDPREAIALTRNAFRSAQKQLCSLRDQTAVATILILAVIRAGLASG